MGTMQGWFINISRGFNLLTFSHPVSVIVCKKLTANAWVWTMGERKAKATSLFPLQKSTSPVPTANSRLAKGDSSCSLINAGSACFLCYLFSHFIKLGKPMWVTEGKAQAKEAHNSTAWMESLQKHKLAPQLVRRSRQKEPKFKSRLAAESTRWHE